jgi:hypothetical protein
MVDLGPTGVSGPSLTRHHTSHMYSDNVRCLQISHGRQWQLAGTALSDEGRHVYLASVEAGPVTAMMRFQPSITECTATVMRCEDEHVTNGTADETTGMHHRNAPRQDAAMLLQAPERKKEGNIVHRPWTSAMGPRAVACRREMCGEPSGEFG